MTMSDGIVKADEMSSSFLKLKTSNAKYMLKNKMVFLLWYKEIK